MPPSISLRTSIRWPPDPATEPTTTVVLTSPQNRFVDVRILRDPSAPEHEGEYLHSTNPRQRNVGTKLTHLKDHLPLSRLDWAFAGTSHSRLPDEETRRTTGCVAHATWRHWVDSRHVDAESVTDAGDMFALPDGRTLEKGRMVNPATGEMGDYEEVWRDVAVESGEWFAVLVLENAEARGMVVRLGAWCQGVVRYGEEVSVERWKLEGKGSGWRREVNVGIDWVPCGLVTGEKVPEVGGTVRYGGWEWVVVEKGVV